MKYNSMMLASPDAIDGFTIDEPDHGLRVEAQRYLANIPDYFPEKDRQRVAEQTARMMRCIDAGDDHYAEVLMYAHSPYEINQSHFAISEEFPLVLDGPAMPVCIGVMLMNEETGRSMAVHLEARDEGYVDVQADAYKFVEQIAYLFDDQPTRIDLVSLLGGAFPHHEAVREALVDKFGAEVITDGYHTGRVIAHPEERRIAA